MNRYREFLMGWTEYHAKRRKELRTGQSLSNFLFEFDKEMYDRVIMSDIDCYYNDSMCCDVIKLLRKEWLGV